MSASKEAGLVDVKIVSFSERLSGLKLMIPLEKRMKDDRNKDEV